MTAAEIKGLRTKLNLSKEQFAQLFDVHPITVMRWEKEGDKTKPSPYQEALMDSFQKSAEEKEVQETLGKVLIGLGIVAALFLLLSKAKGK